MRYLIGFILALAVSPAVVHAQGAQKAGSRQEPSLWVVSDWQTLEDTEHAERRVRLAGRVGLPISLVVLATGAITFGASYSCPGSWGWSWEPPPPCPPVRDRNVGARIAGSTLMAVGAVGMIVSGALLGVRKRELRELQQAHRAKRRRAQWDLVHRRLVF